MIAAQCIALENCLPVSHSIPNTFMPVTGWMHCSVRHSHPTPARSVAAHSHHSSCHCACHSSPHAAVLPHATDRPTTLPFCKTQFTQYMLQRCLLAYQHLYPHCRPRCNVQPGCLVVSTSSMCSVQQQYILILLCASTTSPQPPTIQPCRIAMHCCHHEAHQKVITCPQPAQCLQMGPGNPTGPTPTSTVPIGHTVKPPTSHPTKAPTRLACMYARYVLQRGTPRHGMYRQQLLCNSHNNMACCQNEGARHFSYSLARARCHHHHHHAQGSHHAQDCTTTTDTSSLPNTLHSTGHVCDHCASCLRVTVLQQHLPSSPAAPCCPCY